MAKSTWIERVTKSIGCPLPRLRVQGILRASETECNCGFATKQHFIPMLLLQFNIVFLPLISTKARGEGGMKSLLKFI